MLTLDISNHGRVSKILILAFEKVQKRTNVSLGLWLVGFDAKSAYDADYRALIFEHKISNIFIEPRQPVEKILPMIECCDALIVPQVKSLERNSSASTKFMEYCAASKAIIGTDVSYIGEMIKEFQCGVVAPDSTPDDLANAMLELININKSQLLDMGRNARKLAEEKFAIEKVAEQLNAMIQYVAKCNS